MRWFLVPLLLVALAPRTEVRAQTPQPAGVPANRVCSLRVDPGGVTSREGALLNIHDSFQVFCNDGANLRASSGVYDQMGRIVTLTGNVYFEDPTRSLTSDRAVYNNVLGMLHATGNVVFTDREEGTTLTGPELEYFRANEQRSEALVNAYGRPRLTLHRRPSGGEEAEPAVTGAAPADTAGTPLTIDADRMTIEGRNDLTAIGNVVIEDENMRAVADEAEQRGTAETLELRGGAEIHSREYSLAAGVIFATIPGGSIREVEARRDARLLGTDLNVEAPELDLLFEENLLQRSIARADEALAPGVRPVATSPNFRLEANTIEANLPGQRLETVVAIGNARGETIDTAGAGPPPTDSLAGPPAESEDTPGGVAAMFESGDSVTTVSGAELVENDWITGDTITGYFASIVSSPEDTLTGPENGGADASGIVGEDQEGSVEPGVGEGELALDTAAARSDTTLVMERLVAVGAARSLYHVAPEAGSPPGTRPGINFLSAAHIELRFSNGQVQVADVSGLRRGLYLEPIAAASPPADVEDGAAAEGENAAPGEADADESTGPDEPAQAEAEPADSGATDDPGVEP